MKNKLKLKDSPERIFDLLIEWMASLGASKTAIKAVVILLPMPEQRFRLMEWMSKTMETHEPTEGEIVEQAMLISDEQTK